MRDTIHFLFQGETVELRNPQPTKTLLNWLRRDMGLIGTKEGCSEGGCGACTVVVGELSGDTIRYGAINACMIFLPTLNGKQLISVEDLKDDQGELHPVQQSMVDCHGSQCGFCTPGFVMALFAMYHSQDSFDLSGINDAFAGNLCRCTGYGPIIAAAKSVLKDKQPDQFDRRKEETLAALRSIRPLKSVKIEHDDSRYFAPVSPDELTGLLEQHPDAVLFSGATDVGLWVTKQHRIMSTLIYLGHVRGLDEIRVDSTGIEIGATVNYSNAFENLVTHFPTLDEVLRRFGSVQVRNVGTIGGNIGNGSPIGDTLPVLISLGAGLRLRSARGVRKIPIEDYFIDYGKQDLRAGEFIESIRVPLLKKDALFSVYKVSKRFDEDISAVVGSFMITRENGLVQTANIAFGGMAATPKRAAACEQVLNGASWNEETVNQAAAALTKDFSPISDVRASAGYRSSLASRHKRSTGNSSINPIPPKICTV